VNADTTERGRYVDTDADLVARVDAAQEVMDAAITEYAARVMALVAFRVREVIPAAAWLDVDDDGRLYAVHDVRGDLLAAQFGGDDAAVSAFVSLDDVDGLSDWLRSVAECRQIVSGVDFTFPAPATT
jgi:hypothetical protein